MSQSPIDPHGSLRAALLQVGIVGCSFFLGCTVATVVLTDVPTPFALVAGAFTMLLCLTAIPEPRR